jgi:hypothetical protein
LANQAGNPLQLTIDSSERLNDVLQAVGGLFGVSLTVGDAAATTSSGRRPARAGRKATKATTTGRRGTGRRRRASAGRSTGAADIRAWARAHGRDIADRGRIPSDVIAAYNDANG